MKANDTLWSRPELTVVLRSRPEEAVLTFCKGGQGLTSNKSTNGGCYKKNCSGLCNAQSAS